MKFLIKVGFKNIPEPDVKTARQALTDSIAHLKSVKNKLEALYGYGHGDVIAVLDVGSAEDAWKFATSSPMARFLNIEVHAVTDPVVIQEHLLANLKA